MHEDNAYSAQVEEHRPKAARGGVGGFLEPNSLQLFTNYLLAAFKRLYVLLNEWNSFLCKVVVHSVGILSQSIEHAMSSIISTLSTENNKTLSHKVIGILNSDSPIRTICI